MVFGVISLGDVKFVFADASLFVVGVIVKYIGVVGSSVVFRVVGSSVVFRVVGSSVVFRVVGSSVVFRSWQFSCF